MVSIADLPNLPELSDDASASLMSSVMGTLRKLRDAVNRGVSDPHSARVLQDLDAALADADGLLQAYEDGAL